MTSLTTTDTAMCNGEWLPALLQRGRITQSDVAQLRRDVFPFGLSCRQDAEGLFAVDRRLLDWCPAWLNLFAELIVDFLVWSDRPTGRIDHGSAEWIIAEVDVMPTAAGIVTLIALTEEATAMPSWFPAAVRRRAAANWRGTIPNEHQIAA